MLPTLERRAGITPFERNPFGVRPVVFGALIVDRARLIQARIEISECALEEIRKVFGEMGMEA